MRLSVSRSLSCLAATLVLSTTLCAQSGAGAPGCYISVAAAIIGDTMRVDMGFPNQAGAPILLSLSDGPGPSIHPTLGPIWLDITSAAYWVSPPFIADANGNVHLDFPLPLDPALYFAGPLYANAFTAGSFLPAPGWSLSKTVLVQFDTLDGYRPTAPLLAPRAGHSATNTAANAWDNLSIVLIAGGYSGSILASVPLQSTEIYEPVLRAFVPGPIMSAARAHHRAARLPNGGILLSGGLTTGGTALNTCEIFDRASRTFGSTGSMNVARAGHEITILSDGRIFASGGISTWQNANTRDGLNISLDTAIATGEVYDPATGVWTLVQGNMASPRVGHRQTRLDDGRVLVSGGSAQGTILTGGSGVFPGGTTTWSQPLPTPSCDFFDPATNSWQSAPSIPAYAASSGPALGVAFHGSSKLINGRVLITGGMILSPISGTSGGLVETTSRCFEFDPSASTWTLVPPLSGNLAAHVQLESELNSDAIVLGGFNSMFSFTGLASAYRHLGTPGFYPTLPIGTHALVAAQTPLGRGKFTVTSLMDGTYLIVGGANGEASVLGTAFTIRER